MTKQLGTTLAFLQDDPEDGSVTVKRGRGRPKGKQNKMKVTLTLHPDTIALLDDMGIGLSAGVDRLAYIAKLQDLTRLI